MSLRLSPTFSFYIGRHFLVSFIALLAIFLGLIFLFDIIELLRRSSSRPNVTLDIVLRMALLKLPHMGQETFPFAVLFGAMVAFWRLTRSAELVVARAAGVSVWQFTAPVIVVTILLGLFQIGAVNPLASVMLSGFQRIEATYLRGQKSFLAISESGLWLRQANRNGQSVVHAETVFQQGIEVELQNVTIFVYEGKDRYVGRIDADSAKLEDGFWHLTNAWNYHPEEAATFEKERWFETDLTLSRIQDSFAPPETMSFWDLPSFINTLEDAGFSAVRHKLHWHSLMAQPLLLCAMILIAATFTLRHSRRGGTTAIISAGVMAGFLLYFFSDIVFALGLSGNVPIILAAWTPSGVSTMLGLAMLLHLEDG